MQLLNWPKASQKQYQALFGLEEKVFSKPILEYRCGPTLLNARHPLVTSMDEIFAYPPDTINAHLKDENIPLDFYQDYVKGYKEGRYLPLKNAKKLPFADFRFDTALCTYPLFESDKSSEDVIKELDELLRVAKVVYLAPHQFDSEKIANILGPVMLFLQHEDIGVAMTPVAAENGLNKAVMLKLWAQTCQRPSS